MFGCIAAGRWVQTDMQTINETNFTFTLPNGRSVNHITIFILPGVSIPETHVATVHVRFPNSPDFKILGGISNTKPSAIFRLRGMLDPNSQLMLGAEDWNVVIGISIQEIAVAQAALAQLPAAGTGEATGASSGALVPASAVQKVAAMGTLQLARKIISNAFNYLGSFSKNVGGEEVVPLAAFQEWWKKFEKKVEYDPSFLERPEE
ncbi:hypothetical protein BZA77DRAFT_248796 [Pyronema omphalodes]|nr:hypothetical protein BZA77DRAFT_248796 [Pyronema omphalodes]